MPLSLDFNFSSLRVRGSRKRKKKEKSFSPPSQGSAMLRSLCSIPCLLITNAGSILSNSFPFTLFILSSEKDRSSLLWLRCSFLLFLCVQEWRHWGFRTKCVLAKKWVGFRVCSRLGRKPSLPGEESDFIIQLETWRNRVYDWIFRSASEVFLFFVLQCVRQIPVMPGKKEIWVKRRAVPYAL